MSSLEIPKIYLCEIKVEYKYKKAKLSKTIELVTKYKTIYGMMSDDITRHRIERELYPKTYKSEKSFIIKKVLNAKHIGNMSKQSFLNQRQ